METAKEKFAFQVPTIPMDTIVTLRLKKEIYERLSLAAERTAKNDPEIPSNRRINKKRILKGNVSELIRQMIEHCLKDMEH